MKLTHLCVEVKTQVLIFGGITVTYCLMQPSIGVYHEKEIVSIVRK